MALLQAVAFDCDGNGKQDLVILTQDGGMALLNRGFGSFYVDYTVHPKLRPPDPKRLPFAVTQTTRLAAGKRQRGGEPRQNLFVLTEDGRLFEMVNVKKE